MLETIKILHLKSIDNASLQLTPLTLLTGTNSSGKSTVIQALMLLIKYSNEKNRYSMEELTKYLNTFSTIRNKKENAKAIEIKVIDNRQISHFVNITVDGIKKDSHLNYLYENNEDNTSAELFYLNANRLGAQEFVSVSERKVGNLGEYLFSSFEKIKGTVLPLELIYFEGSKTIAYQLSQWLRFITGTSTELVTEKVIDHIKVSFRIPEIDSHVSPFNLGAGMSYIAKVLIICLMAKKGDLVLLENPEIQLHPKAQSLLAVFFTFISSQGIQLIIETHCEHLINKIAYQVYEEKINTTDVVIHYKPSISEPFQTLSIDDNGKFNNTKGEVIGFPSGFFDATLDELMQMR